MNTNKSSSNSISRRKFILSVPAASLAGCTSVSEIQGSTQEQDFPDPLETNTEYTADEIPVEFVSPDSRKIIESADSITLADLSSESAKILQNLSSNVVRSQDVQMNGSLDISQDSRYISQSTMLGYAIRPTDLQTKARFDLYAYNGPPDMDSSHESVQKLDSTVRYIQPQSTAESFVVKLDAEDVFKSDRYLNANGIRLRLEGRTESDDKPQILYDHPLFKSEGGYSYKSGPETHTYRGQFSFLGEQTTYPNLEYTAESLDPNESSTDRLEHKLSVDIPESHYKFAQQQHPDQSDELYPFKLDYSTQIPQSVSGFDRSQYSVLDHPIYNSLANQINAIVSEEQPPNPHYARIKLASQLIDSISYQQDWAADKKNYIRLPEEYLLERTGDCVGHTFNLCWLLYHLGYTVSAMEYGRSSGGVATHISTIVQIPRNIIQSEFPDDVSSLLHSTSTSGSFNGESVNPKTEFPLITEDLVTRSWTENPGLKTYEPDTVPTYTDLGPDPWINLESTNLQTLGRMYNYNDVYGIDEPTTYLEVFDPITPDTKRI